jgi:hypothetical protein
MRDHRRSTHPVKIFNETIAWTNETKYLGITLDSKLTHRTHIACILRKANYRQRQLYPIVNKSSTIDIRLALVIYKSLLLSILTYASPVWGYAADTHMITLQTFQNKVLRIITKLPRVTPIVTLHEQTGMSLMRNHIKRLTRALYQKSVTSENSQIQELGHYDPIGNKHLRHLSLLAS